MFRSQPSWHVLPSDAASYADRTRHPLPIRRQTNTVAAQESCRTRAPYKSRFDQKRTPLRAPAASSGAQSWLGRASLLLMVFAVVVGLAPQATAATRVPLRLDELRERRTVAWPVTTGVPFPEGGLRSASQCRLVDDRGAERPLQSKVAATWDVGRTSIRWLTLDFIAEPGRSYALEYGPDITRRVMPSPLVLTTESLSNTAVPARIPDTLSAPRRVASLAVTTGPLAVDFQQRGPAALGGVRADLNGNGVLEESERVAGGPAAGEHLYVNQAAQRFSSTGDGMEREVVVEAAGPVRCCVRVDGWYTGPKGERVVKYRTRYHLYAGLSVMKVIDEFRIVGSTKDTRFADIALPLAIAKPSGKRQIVLPKPGEPDAPPVSVEWKSDTESISTVQETYRHFGNLECRSAVVRQGGTAEETLHPGEKSGPWLQMRDDRVAITGSLRWMWQQFPKQWEATGDTLALHLWSPRVEPLDFGEEGLRRFFGPAGEKYLLNWGGVRSPQSPIENFFYFAGRHALKRDGADGLGINKHHELWYHFGPASAAAQGAEYGDLADRQPLCLATGEWNVSTGVFGPLAARPNDSPAEAIVDRIFDLERYAQDTFGDYGFWLFGSGPHYSYQWDKETQRHYADPRRFEYHTYQRETQLWWCYLRSGERKFYDWAIPSENHWVDIAVSHVPTKFSTEWRGGVPGEATLHYPAGDWSIDSPLHYVRHHDTGEAWLRSALQFWASYHRTLETTTLAYYLTGDERYNDVVDFWRQFWGALAGVRSDTAEVAPVYREQLWFVPTKPGEPRKTWSQMLRDYAPFQSGSRHQQTLFLSLSTLYEHTWDPQIATVLREYADAFLDPDAPNGVWQCHDHHLPANSDCPLLSHYWSPALWKYARASRDPRMPGILKKYFTACAEADPYEGDVGIYSNSQIAWGWHFTRDPRHLVAARNELAALKAHAEPLAKPEDLGQRIYNPYAPIKTLAAVPRLIAVLDEAKKLGIEVPAAPPLAPQRTWIAIRREAKSPLRAVLWGWDETARLLDAEGKPTGSVAERLTHRSFRQPFDRALAGFKVFRTVVEAERPAARETDGSGSAWAFVAPRLETGLVELSGAAGVWCWGGEPIRAEAGESWYWRRGAGEGELLVESAQVGRWQLFANGQPVAGKVVKTTLRVPLADVPRGAVIELRANAASGQPVWFKLSGRPATELWVTPAREEAVGAMPRGVPPHALPPLAESVLTRIERAPVSADETFVAGKFGQGLLMVPGRELHIPDEVPGPDGNPVRLSDVKQGTIDFWIRRLWEERLTPITTVTLMSNGSQQVWIPGKLPFDEWAHVAVVWRPVEGITDRVLVHIYINGRDHATYRNLIWAGYSPPPTFPVARAWTKSFVLRAAPGVSYVLDDLRLRTIAAYADLKQPFGRSQTYNPFEFAPPTAAATATTGTVLRLAFDGSTTGIVQPGPQTPERTLETKLVRERTP